MNNKNINKEDEILSLNENILDVFSVKELEQRLQISAAKPWACGANGSCGCLQDTPGPEPPPCTVNN